MTTAHILSIASQFYAPRALAALAEDLDAGMPWDDLCSLIESVLAWGE